MRKNPIELSKMISAIIPIYNSEKYLIKCIESILQQDYQNFEVILVDDGSLDSCGRICDKYAERNKNIRVIHQENAGVSAARNAGLSMAQGDYVIFIDSDDWIEFDCFSILYRYMHPGGMAICDLQRTESRRDKKVKVYALNKIEAYKALINHKKIDLGIGGKLFDRRIIVENNLCFCNDITRGEDALFCIQYLMHITEVVTWVQKALYHYRCNTESVTYEVYKRRENLDSKIFSSVLAFERAIDAAKDDIFLIKLLQTRLTEEKRGDLRIMVINGWEDHFLYREYLHDIRKDLLSFLTCDIGQSVSGRLGAILACINPHLEYYVWKICKRKTYD